LFEQHCPLLKQGKPPFPMQPHFPLLHCCEQHVCVPKHPCPSGEHGAVHIPLVHFSEQHSAASVHGFPAAAQLAVPQKPLAQLPEQHCWLNMHPERLAPPHRNPPHTLLLHCMLQQSDAFEHGSPSAVHAGAPELEALVLELLALELLALVVLELPPPVLEPAFVLEPPPLELAPLVELPVAVPPADELWVAPPAPAELWAARPVEAELWVALPPAPVALLKSPWSLSPQPCAAAKPTVARERTATRAFPLGRRRCGEAKMGMRVQPSYSSGRRGRECVSSRAGRRGRRSTGIPGPAASPG
jgi:hypothetical protein